MQLFPAIDLRGGKVVRLTQGLSLIHISEPTRQHC